MQKDFYRQYFAVENRHWWFIGRRRIVLDILRQHLPQCSNRPLELFDIGCGTGTMLGYLAELGNVHGADADEEAIHFCHQRGVSNVSKLRPGPLPYPSESIDVITMLDVLEHIADDAATLREAYRVLRPNGIIVLTVPAFSFLWGQQDEVSMHKRRYLAKQIARLLRDAGFSTEKLTYFNTVLFVPIAAIRIARRLLPKPSKLESDFGITTAFGLNAILSAMFSLERHWLKHLDFPFGVSILSVARRK